MREQLVPELRFHEFEGEWEEKKLGEIGNLKKGKGIPKSKLTDKGIKCILYGQLYTTYGEVVKEVNSYTNIDKKNLFFGQKGDILIPSSGETALDMSMVSALFKDNVALGGDINVLSPKVNVVSSKFLSYQINSVRKIDIAKIAEGASVVHLYNDNLIKVKVYIPSLQEQQKIGGFFYKTDKKLKLQQEKIDNLKKYKKGMMQRIFSQEIRFKDDNGNDYPDWEEKKLGEVSDVRDGTHDSPKYQNNGKVFITSKNLMSNGKIDFSDINYISDEDFKKINKRSKVDIGDILFGMIGTIGNPVLVDNDNFAIKNVALIKEKKGLLNSYLIYYLESDNISKQFYLLNTGGTQKFIGLGLIRSLNIKVPSLQEQTKIANFLSSIDKKIELEEEKLEEYKKLKKGLMQRMFI